MAAVAAKTRVGHVQPGRSVQISWEPRDDPKDPADDAKSDEAPD